MTNDDVMNALLEKMLELENEIKELRKEQEKTETILYGTKELAAAMGISYNYGKKLMAHKSFPSIKLGGVWKVSKKALNEWLEHNRWHQIELEY